jgi:hemolysin D
MNLNNQKKNKNQIILKTNQITSDERFIEAKEKFYKRIEIIKRWLLHEAFPYLHRVGENSVSILVAQHGQENWTALKPSRKWNSVVIWTLVYIAGFGFVWSVFARVDETVQSFGKLEPRGTTIDVKVPVGGVIKEILVKEGEIVDEDQILLQLDTTAAESKLKALRLVKSQVEADILLSKMQLGGNVNVDELSSNQRLRLESLNKEYNSRIEASKNDIKQSEFSRESAQENLKSIQSTLKVREEILENLRPLQEIGGISKVKFLKEEVEVLQLRGRLASAKAELSKAEESLLQTRNRLDNTIAASNIDFSTKIDENTKQLAQLENQINETLLTLSYQELKSPVNGIVFDLQPAVPGYVVNSNLPILKIVPSDDLVARIFISNRDIAFIKKGQRAKIRVDAYPYNEFGELSGIIDSIGSDVLEPNQEYDFYRFPVTIKLDAPFILRKNKQLPLITGMSLSANMVLRSRPVISLFTEKLFPFWDKLEQL